MIHYLAQNEVSRERDCFIDVALNWDDVFRLSFLIVFRNESSIFGTVSESAEFFAPYQFCDRFLSRWFDF